MAKRAMQTTGQVFMYAIATGRASRNPVPDLKGALEKSVSKNRAYLKSDELPKFLRKLLNYDGADLTKLAFKFLLLTFVRTIELRGATPEEISLDKAEWRIPADRMKMKEEHIVPLSKQSVQTARELIKLAADQEFLFPNEHNQTTYMSENTLLYALYRMGYRSRATVHGFPCDGEHYSERKRICARRDRTSACPWRAK